MRILPIFSIVLMLSSLFAGFSYIESINGTNEGDVNEYYKFSEPRAVCFSDGKLYVADADKSALFIMDGKVREKAVMGGSSSDLFSNPMRVRFFKGVAYVADGISTFIKMYKGDGYNVDRWNKVSNLEKPSSFLIKDGLMYVLDMNAKKLFVYDFAQAFYKDTLIWPGPSDGQLSSPADIEFYNGKYYISDSAKGVIFVYGEDFNFLQTIGRGKGGVTLSSPQGFEIYNDRIYVADPPYDRIVVFTLDGYPVESLNSSIKQGNLSYPYDVTIADGKLYVADSGNGLVKVFLINETLVDGDVQGMLQLANDSIIRLYGLGDVALKLGLEFSPGKAEQDYVAALTNYNNFDFSSAASLAASAKDSADDAWSDLSFDVRFKIQQVVKKSRDSVEPYKGKEGVSEDLKEKVVKIGNYVQEAEKWLSASEYKLSADSAIRASELADSFSTEATSAEEAEISGKQNMSRLEYETTLSELSFKLGKLQKRVSDYQQEADFSNSIGYLASANKSISEGDFASADHSLQYASIEIGSYEIWFDKVAFEIDTAKDEIGTQKEILDSSIRSVIFPTPDFTEERKAMLEAEYLVYKDPASAVAKARDAAIGAEEKARSAGSVSLVITSLVAVLALLFVGMVVLFFYVRNRKKKGLDDV